MADNELFGNSEQLNDLISRRAAMDAIKEDKIDLTDPNVVAVFKATGDFEKVETQVMTCDRHIKILENLPSEQPAQSVAKDICVPVKDCISRQAALGALGERPVVWSDNDDYTLGARNQYDMDRLAIETVPSAQANLSEAYSKAVFTWLMDYQIRVAELKGRYTPYEVLSWVINDWRKEHERSD